MQTIESIKNRVRQILDDAAGARFSDTLLENAIRQALARLDERLPLLRTLDQQISTAGRDVTLTGMDHPLYLIEVTIVPTSAGGCVQALKTGYSYTLQGAAGSLHFNDATFLNAGETLRVTYAAQNTLSGLDDATTTAVPEAAATALETGSASFACLLRAANLAEAYGARTGESARLVEQSRLWQELSDESLNKFKNYQPFDYPCGFSLDQWDR
jgi:hypothetical protein